MGERVDNPVGLEGGNGHETLATGLVDRLVAAIVSGELVPGEKLSEPELAQRFGTSRGPLREALQRLEGMRLVERRAHQGAWVAQIDRGALVDLYDVRESLEGLACRLAAASMTADEIGSARALLDEHERSPDVRADRSYFQDEGPPDFHFRIVTGSRNEELIAVLVGQLYHRIRLYRSRSSRITNRPLRALKEHHQILDAIEAGDGELAEMLMRRHIRSARASIEAELD